MSTAIATTSTHECVLGEREFARRLSGVVAAAESLLGADFGTAAARDDGPEAAAGLLAAVAIIALDTLQSLDRGDARVQPVCDLALRVADLETALRVQLFERRRRALAGVDAAMSRLRRMSTQSELVDNVCLELVRSCGFSRAMLSRVDGDVWMPWMTYFSHREVRPSDREWMAGTRIPIGALPLERDLLDEQHAGFVLDAAVDRRTHKAFVAATGVTSYVVAPVIPAGRAIGFLHADHFPYGRAVDGVDRDILWAFAEGFGRIYERMVLFERLNGQRHLACETLRAVEVLMGNVACGELELARREDQRGAAAPAPALVGGRSSLDDLLTPREREVLALIVAGHSNSAIAARLVISKGTVKSHVKQILRKIGAANRSEAIARYLGLIGSG